MKRIKAYGEKRTSYIVSFLLLLWIALPVTMVFGQVNPLTSPEDVKDMFVDNYGNVYVTGTSHGPCCGPHSPDNVDIVIIKYDSRGNVKWIARYDNEGSGSSDIPIAIEVDIKGNVYVAGSASDFDFVKGQYGPSDFLVLKYDSRGNQKWVARFNGPGNDADVVKSFSIDDRGHVYVTGNTLTPPTSSVGGDEESDIVTIEYDPNGRELWVQIYDGPNHFTTTTTTEPTTTTTTSSTTSTSSTTTTTAP